MQNYPTETPNSETPRRASKRASVNNRLMEAIQRTKRQRQQQQQQQSNSTPTPSPAPSSPTMSIPSSSTQPPPQLLRQESVASDTTTGSITEQLASTLLKGMDQLRDKQNDQDKTQKQLQESVGQLTRAVLELAKQASAPSPAANNSSIDAPVNDAALAKKEHGKLVRQFSKIYKERDFTYDYDNGQGINNEPNAARLTNQMDAFHKGMCQGEYEEYPEGELVLSEEFMSDDETDDDEEKKNGKWKALRVRQPAWRSELVNDFFACLDKKTVELRRRYNGPKDEDARPPITAPAGPLRQDTSWIWTIEKTSFFTGCQNIILQHPSTIIRHERADSRKQIRQRQERYNNNYPSNAEEYPAGLQHQQPDEYFDFDHYESPDIPATATPMDEDQDPMDTTNGVFAQSDIPLITEDVSNPGNIHDAVAELLFEEFEPVRAKNLTVLAN
ncbi:hypothetical protein BDA99DRAFT_566814 [Phascolomyces articulosus]|uniref:Uncharacterized protein n=1 Tax=Phascolomyces articulosus TaxID=60185 RepID=A0AAD5P6L1_9FUNG|nr:hypothetical protein BDA99DRAFT_566814 [Phascolomyces articulosus]